MAVYPGVECDRLFRVFARWVEDALFNQTLDLVDEPGVTPAQFRCLDFLARHDVCSVGSLSEGLAISDPAATKLIDRLQGKGLVGRQMCENDRRVVYVQLSVSGSSLVEELARKRERLIGSAIGRLSYVKRQMLVRSLESVLLSALDSPEVVERVCLRCGASHSPDCVVNRAHVRLTGSVLSVL